MQSKQETIKAVRKARMTAKKSYESLTEGYTPPELFEAAKAELDFWESILFYLEEKHGKRTE